MQYKMNSSCRHEMSRCLFLWKEISSHLDIYDLHEISRDLTLIDGLGWLVCLRDLYRSDSIYFISFRPRLLLSYVLNAMEIYVLLPSTFSHYGKRTIRRRPEAVGVRSFAVGIHIRRRRPSVYDRRCMTISVHFFYLEISNSATY